MANHKRTEEAQLKALQQTEHLKTEEQMNLKSQMKRLEQELKSINVELTDINKQIRGHQEIADTKSTVRHNDEILLMRERTRQLDDNALKDLLDSMSERTAPLMVHPTGEEVIKVDNPILHTVKIKYARGVSDGDLDRLKSSEVYEVSLRITKKTTFGQLLAYAVKFWDIQNCFIELRATNFSQLGLVNSRMTVHDMVIEQRSLPEFWLIESNPGATTLLDEDEQYFVDQKMAENFRDNSLAVQKSRLKSDLGKKRNYDKFMQKYYGMEGYIPAQVQKAPPPVDKYDTSCSTATCILLLLILTVFIMTSRRSVEDSYWLTKMIQTKLFNEFNFDKTDILLTDITEINSYILNSLAYSILNSTSDPHVTINDKCLIIGPVLMRILRTKTTSCKGDTYGQDVICYDEKYAEHTRNETLLYIDEDLSLPFRTASDNNIDSIIEGEFSGYDGSGNTFELYTNTT